jgi:hypothetical protein
MADLPVGSITGKPITADVFGKLALLADLIECGVAKPDHVQVAWAAGLLKECGELELARRYERIARRLMPAWARDLT